MKFKHGCGIVMAFFCLQLLLAVQAFAGDYRVSDVSLPPGADETRLNIAWHSGTVEEGDTCKVKIAKKGIFLFPSISSIYTGTTGASGVDGNGVDDYYSEVVVTGLEAGTDYIYQLGDGDGNWSDSYPELDIASLTTSIDELYNAMKNEYASEGYMTDLETLAALDSTLADELLTRIAENLAERKVAVDNDTAGWLKTMGIMKEQFPEAAFLRECGRYHRRYRRDRHYGLGWWGRQQLFHHLRRFVICPECGIHMPGFPGGGRRIQDCIEKKNRPVGSHTAGIQPGP